MAIWNEKGELEGDDLVEVFYEYEKDLQHYNNAMETCNGQGASMVRNAEPIKLIGILGKANPSCENEIKIERTFVKVAHSEVLNFIKTSKKGLKKSLKKSRF